MKHIAIAVILLGGLFLGVNVSAQSSGSFESVLREQLEVESPLVPSQTSATSNAPALGSSERFEESDTDIKPFNAGRDTVSSIVAGGAVVLAAVVIILMFVLVALWGVKGSDDSV